MLRKLGNAFLNINPILQSIIAGVVSLTGLALATVGFYAFFSSLVVG